MKHTEIADPKQEFWNSVTKVRETGRDIERLDRQMDIELREIDVRDGQVSRERFASIIGRAVELRLIDSDDLPDMSAQSRDSVKAAFDFVKANAKGIVQVAENPIHLAPGESREWYFFVRIPVSVIPASGQLKTEVNVQDELAPQGFKTHRELILVGPRSQ